MWISPDIEKLAHEVKNNLSYPVRLRAIGVSIVVRYGHDVLRKVYECASKMLIFDDQSRLKDNIAELFGSSSSIRKRTKRSPVIDWRVVKRARQPAVEEVSVSEAGAVTSAPEKTHEAAAQATRLRWSGVSGVATSRSLRAAACIR